MKKVTLFVVLGTLLFCTRTFAQTANTDSLSLIAKISANQLKLAKMQNEVGQTTTDKTAAGDKAKNSADANVEAANKLKDNPDNRKMARNAGNKASDAKTDARSSRKEARKLITLNSDIADMKNKINKDQSKLDKLTGNVTPQLN